MRRGTTEEGTELMLVVYVLCEFLSEASRIITNPRNVDDLIHTTVGPTVKFVTETYHASSATRGFLAGALSICCP